MMFSYEARENQLIVPYTLSKENLFEGGVKDPPTYSRIERNNGKFLDLWCEKIDFIKLNNQIYHGDYLYAGPLFPHFGHVLTESIHRLYAYSNKKYDGVVFTSAWMSQNGIEKISIPKYLSEILSLFRIPVDKCIIVKSPSVFENIDFFEPGSSLQNGPKSWYLDILPSFEPLVSSKSNLPSKIFIGRNHMMENGTVLGEGYIFRELLKNGFCYICPEHHSIEEQYSLIKSAKEIVFTEGSAIYASELISEWNSAVYMLPRRNYDSYFRPHIQPKTTYNVIGDISQVIRIENEYGLMKPNSPSVFNDPSSLLHDLSYYDLSCSKKHIRSNYMASEESDAIAYAKGNCEYEKKLLHTIKSLRNINAQ